MNCNFNQSLFTHSINAVTPNTRAFNNVKQPSAGSGPGNTDNLIVPKYSFISSKNSISNSNQIPNQREQKYHFNLQMSASNSFNQSSQSKLNLNSSQKKFSAIMSSTITKPDLLQKSNKTHVADVQYDSQINHHLQSKLKSGILPLVIPDKQPEVTHIKPEVTDIKPLDKILKETKEKKMDPFKIKMEESFQRVYQDRNEQVRLDSVHLKIEDGVQRKPMICIHGFMASKKSLIPLIDQQEILEQRDCYMLDMRNGEFSDWHDQNSYELFAQDVIRWADKNGIWKFDLLGHSMGAKLSQTIACLYPDRVDGVIALDGAPCQQDSADIHPYYKMFNEIVLFMVFMDRLSKKKELSRKDAIKMIKERFADNRSSAAMLMKLMDQKAPTLKWKRNIESLYSKDGKDTFHFDEGFRSDKESIYHLIAENGPENYDFEVFNKIFKNQKKENMVILKDCSHFIQDEKPIETTEYVLKFLKDINQKSDYQSQVPNVSDVISAYSIPEIADYCEIQFSSNAMAMDECKRDFEMVYGKRPEAPWILTPFRGHRGLGLLHKAQHLKMFRKLKKSHKNIIAKEKLDN